MTELEGLPMDAALRFWEGRVAATTYRTYIIAFRQFMRWLKVNGGVFGDMSPSDLVEYQKGTDNGTKYELLDLVQTWSQNLRSAEGLDWRLSSKKGAYSAVRSFFAHNRAPLPRDPYTLRSETPDSQGSLTIENIRDICLSSKPVYRAIFLSLFQGGMDIQSFLYWNLNGWEDLRRALADPDVEIVKIELPWRKRNRKPFYTFIGADAIRAIRDYLPSRPTEKEYEAWSAGLDERREELGRRKGAQAYVPPPFVPDAIFYGQYRCPLQKSTLQFYWIERLAKLGLIKKKKGRGVRYGKNLHELRDVWRSQWEKSPAKGSIAEFLMGHKGDPLGYQKAYKDEDWTQEQYLLALPLLEIMSETRPYNLIRVSAKGAQLHGMLEEMPEIQDKLLEFIASLKKEEPE